MGEAASRNPEPAQALRRGRGAEGRRLHHAPGRGDLHHRLVRLGQDHAAALHQHARGVPGRAHPAGRRGDRLRGDASRAPPLPRARSTSPASARCTGMAFQQFNLFPHLTAAGNIMLGLVKVKKMARDEARALAETWLAARRARRARRPLSRPALRRPAAARRHRPRHRHEPAPHAVRRGDLRARPRTGRRGARRSSRRWPRTA